MYDLTRNKLLRLYSPAKNIPSMCVLDTGVLLNKRGHPAPSETNRLVDYSKLIFTAGSAGAEEQSSSEDANHSYDAFVVMEATG